MTDKNETNKKDDIYWAVLNCALELEIKKGHLKWTMTELARKSKITRSLIYYYFGRSKMDIVKAAITIIGEEVAGMKSERIEMWKRGEFVESMMEARKYYDRMPYLCSFYLKYREYPNDLGQALLEMEKSFIKKVRTFAPKATPEQANAMFAAYFGFAFAPNIGNGEIKIFGEMITGIFKQLN